MLERAGLAGVEALVVTGTCIRTATAAAELCSSPAAQQHGLYFTAGIHPHNAKVRRHACNGCNALEWQMLLLTGWLTCTHLVLPPTLLQDCTDSTLDALRRLAAHERCVAIGECGLDFNRNFSPPEVQERWFAAQVELAEELQLPLFMHCRDAGARFAALLAAHRRSVPGVVHCFTGGRDELEGLLAAGLHIGITGWCADDRPERGGAELAALLSLIPGRHSCQAGWPCPGLCCMH